MRGLAVFRIWESDLWLALIRKIIYDVVVSVFKVDYTQYVLR